MPVSRRLARPLLASMFVMGGADALLHPEAKAERARRIHRQVAAPLGVPEDPATLVRINGAVQVAAGALLAVGKLPRLAALTLAASLVPTTLAGHSFWDEADDRTRAMQRIQFFKNMSMLGGLMLAAVDTEGRPSLSWRAHRAAGQAAGKIGDVAGHVRPG